jgi:hypothetical protein
MRYKTENETMNNGGKQSRVSTNSPILQRINTKKKKQVQREEEAASSLERIRTPKGQKQEENKNWM